MVRGCDFWWFKDVGTGEGYEPKDMNHCEVRQVDNNDMRV